MVDHCCWCVQKTHPIQIVVDEKLQNVRHMRFVRLIDAAEYSTVLE